MNQRKSHLIAGLLGFLAGALLDFLIYGVAKIIWAVIYVPLYAVVGSTLHSKMASSKRPYLFKTAYFSLLAGAAMAHVLAVNRHRTVTYSMTSSATQPFTLHSPEWPRILIVNSAKLAQDLAGKPLGKEIEVKVDVVSDFGCFTSFLVNTVDGVDVKSDPEASWTWKADSKMETKSEGPGLEDQELPWCRIHFYRPST